MAAMRNNWTLLVSFGVHAAILLMAIVVLPTPDEHKIDAPPPIAVNIEDFQDVAKRANQTTEEVKKPLKPDEKPKVKKVEKKIDKPSPKPAEEIKQAARQPQAQPEPKPEPKPDPKPAEAPQPDPSELAALLKKTEDIAPEPKPVEEPKKAQNKPVPKPRVKPTPPKKVVKKKDEEFKLDEVAALLNKIDDEKAAPTDQSETGTPLQGNQNLTGDDRQVTATALDWLRQRVGQCWNIPAGARDAAGLIVTLRFQLDINGNLTAQPVVERVTNHPAAGAAASSALAALIQCQPYDRMPRETHALWQDIRMRFDPSVMVGLN